MGRLTFEQIARENDNLDASSTTSLHHSHRALTDGLSPCINLKWLSVVENKLETLKGIEYLSKLTVLNAGKNKLRKINEIGSVTSLRALILNDNNISSICKLDKLEYLNTLGILGRS